MNKQQTSIDIDVQDGYELFREAGFCELPSELPEDCLMIEVRRRFVIRKKFVWPDSIRAGLWFAIDSDGSGWIHENEPTLVRDEWESIGAYWSLRSMEKIIVFPPFPDVPFKQSKMQKTL